MRAHLFLAALWIGASTMACGSDDDDSGDGDADVDSDGDTDTDGDTDGDTDVDGDADTDADTDGDADGDQTCDDPCNVDFFRGGFGSWTCCLNAYGEGRGCTDLQWDSFNCGACGTECGGETPLCDSGRCVGCDEMGLTNCEGVCADLQLDNDNCSACGTACDPGTVCVGGTCVGGDCELPCDEGPGPEPGPEPKPLGGVANGGVCCDSPWGDPMQGCTDLRYDMYNCGACGTSCGDAGWCNAGVCECDVEGGWALLCDGLCVDITWDAQNCGACGEVCGDAGGEGRICSDGVCVTCENLGVADCGGEFCTDTREDPTNCGRCGNACGAGSQCVNGACVAGTCDMVCGGGIEPGGEGGGGGGGPLPPPNEVCCDNAWGGGLAGCTDLNYDAANCATCGHACPADQFCDRGSCVAGGIDPQPR